MTTAARIVASLRLPTREPSRVFSPVSIANLPNVRDDDSIEYGVASIDRSGRIADVGVAASMGWQVGDRLKLTVQGCGILVQRSQDGQSTLPQKRLLTIPVGLRRACGIRNVDRVFLVAAPAFEFVLIHSMATLDMMLVNYYGTQDRLASKT
jgi:bifunctional DNA-binding transcriptional regulator/antitoxin component of YhaV-PrlF toxin-antitoxin module